MFPVKTQVLLAGTAQVICRCMEIGLYQKDAISFVVLLIIVPKFLALVATICNGFDKTQL